MLCGWKFDKIVSTTLEIGEPENHAVLVVVNSFIYDKNYLPFASEEQKPEKKKHFCFSIQKVRDC